MSELPSGEPPFPQRKIIHVDMDCFFAAVEMRADPSLKERPLAIGGGADRRGVLATCNYPARKFGLRSAMATARALKLCPDLVLLPPRMDAYKEESREIFEIFRRFTERVEGVSLDEAYLDVTGVELCGGSATRMAEEIREAIRSERNLTASAGVAPNKFLAKVASEQRKPDGLFVLPPAAVDSFVRELPVRKLPGVGPTTEERLLKVGLKSCAELQARGRDELRRLFGRQGERLWELAHGRDDSAVDGARVRRSLSVEETFAVDRTSLEELRAELKDLHMKLLIRLGRFRQAEAQGRPNGGIPLRRLTESGELREKNPVRFAGRELAGAGIKVKWSDFTQTTLVRRAGRPRLDFLEGLLEEVWARRSDPVRLLGVGVDFEDPEALQAGEGVQLELFAEEQR